MSSHGEQDVEQAGMALGAADFIVKPLRPIIVAAGVTAQIRVKEAADRLRELAMSDER